ncbi:MAG TPA: carbohydrate porin [Isosphaeraceae bacterium]|nr:carbohydrate porin [Isosphaeraceae bacterium]
MPKPQALLIALTLLVCDVQAQEPDHPAAPAETAGRTSREASPAATGRRWRPLSGWFRRVSQWRPAPDPSVEEPTSAGATAPPGPTEPAAPSAGDSAARRGSEPISANPAAVNIVAGTGALGRLLDIDPDSGLRLGGLWIGDASGVLAGGRQPGKWGLNSLTIADLNLDTDKMFGWTGGLLGIQFLQFSGQTTNNLAGAFPGFDSLEVTPPLVRQELYQLWYRQSFFKDRFVVRIGKTVPTFDFNNVVRPVPVDDPAAAIPAVSGLIYTPIFVNPTLLGAIPGYYNSATGLTATLAPTKSIYLSYGFYDGNVALGRQTGLEGPHFNGHYFHIGEVGYAYRAGRLRKPGNIGVGYWGQTGKLQAVDGATVNGEQGVYLFGSQRLWFRHPDVDNSGVSGFYQFGANNSNAMLARQYFGAGLTAFGLVPRRPDDSFGFGLALTWLNTEVSSPRSFLPDATAGPTPFRPSQLMLAWYYQMKLFDGCFFLSNLTYIPTPGEGHSIPPALALTMRVIVLF